MIVLREGNFEYQFPTRWQVVKWDDTSFHKVHFQSFGGSSKAAEFVAFDEDSDQFWLIECKDFRPNGRVKTVDLCDEIAQKFRSTLAGLVCARNSDDEVIKQFARMALKKTSIRCAVHWECPAKPHHLWDASNTRANQRTKLRQRLRAADSRAELGNHEQLNASMPWKITQVQS